MNDLQAVALSVWSNTCNSYCNEEDRVHADECLLASGLYYALAASSSAPTEAEERWVPVAESGERWTGRTRTQAEACLRDYPPGGTYLDGEPWDGITHIVHERRHVTEWAEVPAVSEEDE